jgi:hypothetical protein
VDEDTAEDMADINHPLAINTEDWPLGRIVLDVDARDWDGTPRKPWEAMEVLGKAAIVDRKAAKQWLERPFYPIGIDAASGLVLMSRAAGCQCDYRFGCVWVTPGVEKSSWRDPTGACEIEPPAGSPLAASWRAGCRCYAMCHNRPLVECLNAIAGHHRVKIDTRQIDTAFVATSDVSFLEIRHALAKLLLEAGCRCELDGETLVILPQAKP